jgi:outer membrane protein assembly factor BamE (lipoprotein component of BamABCDE complex)
MLSRRLMLVVVLAAVGCSRSRLASKSIDEVKTLLRGKNAKEVISLMGKPNQVEERPAAGGSTEAWYYLNGARHAATGNKMTVIVKFNGGRVVEVVGM